MAGAACGAIALSCTLPTEPTAEERRYNALLSAPAWTLGAARDSAFADLMSQYPESDGLAFRAYQARTPGQWDTLWSSIGPGPAPAVDFASEMVMVASRGLIGMGEFIRIQHVTRQRDTTFVLVQLIGAGRDCDGWPSASWHPIDARVMPVAPPPTRFVYAPALLDCRTDRTTLNW